jgi:hypothetical protein
MSPDRYPDADELTAFGADIVISDAYPNQYCVGMRVIDVTAGTTLAVTTSTDREVSLTVGANEDIPLHVTRIRAATDISRLRIYLEAT